MKKLRTSIYTLATVAAVAAPVAAVVACGARTGGSASGNYAFDTKLSRSTDAKIWMVGDGGKATDKSFNESVLQGIAQYSEYAKPRSLESRYDWTMPPEGQLNTGYKTAVSQGAEVVVGPGFAHEMAAKDYFKPGAEGAGIQFIGVDCDFTSQNNNQLASIVFPTEQPGYIAGIYAVEYLNTHKDEFDAPVNGKYQVAAYGGFNFPSVVSWMDGFKKGIEDADANLQDGMIPAEMVYVNSTASGADFTHGFDKKSPEATAVSKALLTKGADIIFPVAGPQIENTLGVIKDMNVKAKVFGVDGDAALSINDNNIIGSALKSLKDETKSALMAYYSAKKDGMDSEKMKAFVANYITKAYVGAIGFVNAESSPWDEKKSTIFKDKSLLNHENIKWDDSIKTAGWK